MTWDRHWERGLGCGRAGRLVVLLVVTVGLDGYLSLIWSVWMFGCMTHFWDMSAKWIQECRSIGWMGSSLIAAAAMRLDCLQ